MNDADSTVTRLPRFVSMGTVLVLVCGTWAAAQSKPDLNTSITLIGANPANDALAIPVRADSPVPLIMLIKAPAAGYAQGELRTLPFASQEQPPAIAIGTIRTGTSKGSSQPATVMLDKAGEFPLSLEFDSLLPGKTYTGSIFLVSGDFIHRWTVTLPTAGRGTIAVDPIGTQKFVTMPFFPTGRFSFTLSDKSGNGPYTHVHVRLEPTTAPATKSLTSSFGLDAFSFFDREKDMDKEIDFARRDATSSGVTLTKAHTFTAALGPLSPGEYSGTMHFSSDQTADDAADAKLPLLIQVRHHWLLPTIVIVLASAAGWFTSKFVVAARKARALSRQTRDLRGRADFIARASARSGGGWQFSTEAVSLGFARVMVALSRLARLTASTLEVLVHGDEIEQLQQQIDRRITALESLQAVRLRVESAADGRPAAQTAIGRLLRRATDVLDRPTFGEAEQANLATLLDAALAWSNLATLVAVYQQAVLDRRRSTECPDAAGVAGIDAGLVRTQLEALLTAMPGDQVIAAQVLLADLKASDDSIARIALLWRDRQQRWAGDLAAAYAAGKPLDQLFQVVDAGLWKELQDAGEKGQLALEINSGNPEPPLTYDALEVHLTSHATSMDEWRILYHPLRIEWRIQPASGDPRTMETDGLRVVQYFPSAGTVKITSTLRWGREAIPGPACAIDIGPNPDYRTRGPFAADWTEYAAIGGAALFAVVTAMAAQYDSTFGSVPQYLGLVVWAAGAGTGGNLFSQLGTTSAPGGRADAALK